MADLPAPGTFRLYPFAEPPVPAGAYLLSGDVAGMPGDVEQMRAAVHIVAPRYTLPPDQILSTFPPAGARGAFSTRLPQIVLRRRTLPWERAPDLDHDVTTTPTPWLALVLIAEGEGQLKTDVNIADTVTAGVDLGADADVTKGACLEVLERVVNAVFPTRDDLPMLCHLREVDLLDTELALGDDDGYMAVVLGNRLPQPGVKYLACLVNLEGQYDRLPTVPDVELVDRFVSVANVFDLGSLVRASYGDQVSYDTVTMGLPARAGLGAIDEGAAAQAAPEEAAPQGAAQAPAAQAAEQGPPVVSAHGLAARTGSAWASAATGASPVVADAGAKAKLQLADGFSFGAVAQVLPDLLDAVLRFPVLAYWSFTCDEGGDFQYLAERVHVRMLGHVVTGPETPDGDAVGPTDQQPRVSPEPNPTRPLPLVTQTGHVQVDHLSREGEPAPAWFRGPLAPAAVPRAQAQPGQPPPIAHDADQLRRVTPDGQEDLGYAAAFEIGRLLALSQPGVVSALARWRAEAYGAARVRGVVADALQELPPTAATALQAGDPLTDPAVSDRPRTLGARAGRALVGLLGADPAGSLGPTRPVADPGSAAAPLAGVHGQGDAGLLAGLAVAGVTADAEPAQLLAQLAAAPAVVVAAGQDAAGGAGPGDAARIAALRTSLEAAVAAPAADAAPAAAPGPAAGAGPGAGAGSAAGAGPAEGAAGLAAGQPEQPPPARAPDPLDELIARAAGRPADQR